MKGNSEFVIIYKTVFYAKDSAESFTYMSLFNHHKSSKSQMVLPHVTDGETEALPKAIQRVPLCLLSHPAIKITRERVWQAGSQGGPMVPTSQCSCPV